MRKFNFEKVDTLIIERIAEGLLRMPSGGNKNPCEYLFVDDPDLILKLSEAKAQGSQFMAEASNAVVIMANPVQSKHWIEESGMAAGIAYFLSMEFDLGSCWIQIRQAQTVSGETSENYVRRLLAIPQGIRVVAIVAFGNSLTPLNKLIHPEPNRFRLHLNHY